MAVVAPPLAPAADPLTDRAARRWWLATSVLCFFPFGAVLHNRVWWKPICMMNPFGVDYTDWETLKMWLSQDATPSSAALACLCMFLVGRRWWWVRAMAAPIFVCGLPLSVWLWDIPGSGRWVCLNLHNNRLLLWPGQPLTTPLLTVLYLAMYIPLAAWCVLRFARARGRNAGPVSL